MLKVWRPVASAKTCSRERSWATASWLSTFRTCCFTALARLSGLTEVFTTQVVGMSLLLSSMKLFFTCASGMYITAGRGVAEAGLLHVADDAHDLARRLGEVGAHALADLDLLADGVALRPVLLRERLVDDDDARRARGVALAEQAAAPQRDLERFEVGVRDVHPAGAARERSPSASGRPTMSKPRPKPPSSGRKGTFATAVTPGTVSSRRTTSRVRRSMAALVRTSSRRARSRSSARARG